MNTQLRILLQCYKGLCEYIVSKPMYSFVMGAGAGGQLQSNNAQSNGTAGSSSLVSNSLVELIEEGARFKDNYKSNSGLLKSTYSMLPCVYNSLPVATPVSHHVTTDSSTVPANPTPIVVPMVPNIRPCTATVSHSSPAPAAIPFTAPDIKPDIKTFNVVRSPPPQPKHKTQIQLATHQPQNHQVVQPILLQQQHQQSNQQQKQKIWISSMQNKQVSRTGIVPVPNTVYHTQAQSQSQPQSTHPSPTPNFAPIKSSSNGSPMYSVLYAGTGNKITIKRKPDPVDIKDYPNVRLSAPNVATTSASFVAPSPNNTIYTDNKLPALVQSYHLPIPSTTTVRPHLPMNATQPQPQQQQQQFQTQTFGVPIQPPNQLPVFRPQIVQQSFKKPVLARSKSVTAAAAAKRKGCRCGNATPTPGKLTCCGQRCPCYVEAKSCVDCKCRGCRNPHRADGFKVSFMFLVSDLLQFAL